MEQQVSLNVNAQKLARVQAWIGEKTFGEYIGVESYNWTVENFQHWVDTLGDSKPDVVYIKVGEYGRMWYNGNFPAIREYFIGHGIGIVPYIFCRPQWVNQDSNIAAQVAKLCGGVLLDCEEQFLNNNTELYQLVGMVRDKSGKEPVIIVSGYGDPVTAVPGWDFGALHHADAYQPQWYVGWWQLYHSKGYQAAIAWGDGQCATQFLRSGLGVDFPIQPVFNVEDVAPSDIPLIAKYLTQWRASVTVWEAGDISAELRGVIKHAIKD